MGGRYGRYHNNFAVFIMENAMSKFPEAVQKAAESARRREAETFSQWLQLGGLSRPDATTSEWLVEWRRLHELYEFCTWVKGHKAQLKEVSLSEIVAADGPDERRFDPDEGLAPEHWPYIKAVLVPEDDDSVNIDRCAIVDGILKNQVRRRGHSTFAAFSAVQEFTVKTDTVGDTLWIAVERATFEEAIKHLNQRAAAVDQEVREHVSEVLRENSLSVTEAAEIVGINVGTMSRLRERFNLAASDGVRIDGLKFLEWVKIYEPKRKAARPSVAKVQPVATDEDDDDPLSAREAIYFYLKRQKKATQEQIVAGVHADHPEISLRDIAQDLSNPFSYKREIIGDSAVYSLADNED